MIRLRGFKIYKDRHGKWRAYHRKTRTPVDLNKAPIGSIEFFAECARIAALAEKSNPAPKPGTLGLLVSEYRASPSFQDLARQTQADYQKIFIIFGHRHCTCAVRTSACSAHSG